MLHSGRSIGAQIFAALILAAAAALLSVPGRASSLYPDVQWFLTSGVVPAIGAISSSIAEYPAAMIPP